MFGHCGIISGTYFEQDNSYDLEISEEFKKHRVFRDLEANPFSVGLFLKALEYSRQSVMMRSLVWMFARTVPEPKDIDQTDEVYRDGFYKEFDASQYGTFRPQAFNWSDMGFNHIPSRIDFIWHSKLRSIASAFHTYCYAKIGKNLLFPHVNRRRNVSRESASIFKIYNPESQLEEITTKDLECFYGDTGFEIPGPCEMRNAWKFNDLKPRFYYAQGGTSYFASRYIKPIAVALMESCPFTTRKMRTTPDLYLSSDDEDFVCTWDFTSFTTNLSELKFFLHHLVRALEDLRPVEFFAFDYHDGRSTLTLTDMLDHYNQVVNFFPEFTVYRILDRFKYEMENPYEHKTQQQNGMLGVAGNIGFSTTVHGAVMMKSLDKGTCVGDDGLGITKRQPYADLIPTLNGLGNIHPDKFGIISPQSYEVALRFVKRRLDRDEYGQIRIESLFNFPIAPYIDKVFGKRSVPFDLTDYDCIAKIATQTGKLLWDIYAVSYLVSDEEYGLLIQFLFRAYKSLNIPPNGLFPGESLLIHEHTHQFWHFLPGLKDSFGDLIDFRYHDWLDEMLKHWPASGIRAQVHVPTFVPDLPYAGETVLVTRNRSWSALEDMGLVRLKPVYETYMHPSADARRTIMKNLGRLVDKNTAGLYEMHVLHEIPTKFDFVFNTVPTEFVDYRLLSRDI